MRSLTCTSTRLHRASDVNACACLKERRGCDTPTTQGAWLLALCTAPPLLSMNMKRGSACKGARMPMLGASCTP
jgi:hypothetical protein